MKKVFALALAASMVASMASVSMAAEEKNHGIQEMGTTAYRYSADSNAMIEDVIQYGKAAYYPLFGYEKVDYQVNAAKTDVELKVAKQKPHLLSSQTVVEGLKVKVDFEQGAELVADNGISVVKKLINEKNAKLISGIPTAEEGYYYFIEIKTNAKSATSDDDIIATIELNKSKKGDHDLKSSDGKVTIDLNYKIKDYKADITTNVGYENSYLDSGMDPDKNQLYVVNDTVEELADDTYYLLKYSNDEEVEFTFGKEPNEGTFTVDVSGQGKNLLYYVTDLDEGIAAANPSAKIYALKFNNTKFNRTGEFVYEGEDFEYAYELMADGSLKLLGEFSGEEVSFKTRVLGSYLFSDVELVAAPKAAVDAPVDVTPVPNPSTGAAC